MKSERKAFFTLTLVSTSNVERFMVTVKVPNKMTRKQYDGLVKILFKDLGFNGLNGVPQFVFHQDKERNFNPKSQRVDTV